MRILWSFLISAIFAFSQDTRPEMWPGVQYDPAVPAFRKVLGYEPGDRISSHANIMRYMDALACAHEGLRVRQDAGRRKLIYAAIGSELSIRRLSEIRNGMQRPAAPNEPRVAGRLFTKQDDFDKAIQADTELPDPVAGVLARANLDSEHWMSGGAGESVYAMVDDRAIFTPIKLDKGINAAVFAAPDEVVASGYMWEDNRRQIAYKPLVIVRREGRGQIIAFTADPNFRGFMDGMNMLFMNAVLRGPARTR